MKLQCKANTAICLCYFIPLLSLCCSAQPSNLQWQKDGLEAEGCGPGGQKKGCLLLALSPAASSSRQISLPLLVLPGGGGVGGPLSFIGHGEASLLNRCEETKTLPWRYLCEWFLESVLRYVEVCYFLVILPVWEFVNPVNLEVWDG